MYIPNYGIGLKKYSSFLIGDIAHTNINKCRIGDHIRPYLPVHNYSTVKVFADAYMKLPNSDHTQLLPSSHSFSDYPLNESDRRPTIETIEVPTHVPEPTSISYQLYISIEIATCCKGSRYTKSLARPLTDAFKRKP